MLWLFYDKDVVNKVNCFLGTPFQMLPDSLRTKFIRPILNLFLKIQVYTCVFVLIPDFF